MSQDTENPKEIVHRFALNQMILEQARDALAVGNEREAALLMRNFFGLPNGTYESPVGFIYVLRAQNMNRYKIGFSTNNPLARLAGLQTGSPVELTLAAAIPNCTPSMETELHHRFEASRLHGEWFSGTADLLAFIEAHTTL